MDLQLNARLQGLLITAHRLVKELANGFQRCRGRLFGLCRTHIFSFLLFFVFVASAPELLNEYRMEACLDALRFLSDAGLRLRTSQRRVLEIPGSLAYKIARICLVPYQRKCQ